MFAPPIQHAPNPTRKPAARNWEGGRPAGFRRHTCRHVFDVGGNHRHGRPTKQLGSGKGRERVGNWLGAWQQVELRVARGFRECRGLTREQLEDIYQDTAITLLTRSYDDENHLRNALHAGIRQRALKHHRDQRRRHQILHSHAPNLHNQATAHAAEQAPDVIVLAAQDRLIVNEFLADLTPFEQQVFRLQADGLQYRKIAGLFNIDVNLARSTVKSCERKRARYQTLYDAGRLCGYRATTIQALKDGHASSELAAQAVAHLKACDRCRTEHHHNANTLRDRFQGRPRSSCPHAVRRPPRPYRPHRAAWPAARPHHHRTHRHAHAAMSAKRGWDRRDHHRRDRAPRSPPSPPITTPSEHPTRSHSTPGRSSQWPTPAP